MTGTSSPMDVGQATSSDDRLFDHYRPMADAYDECVANDGALRPAYREAVRQWNGVEPGALLTRLRAADRYLSDQGVAHRVYGDDEAGERPWPLSVLPLMIDQSEWQQIERGVIQRAELLEALLGDLYGPQHCIRTGQLPASLVAGAPGFLRPIVGVKPKAGHHLYFIAVELGRGPDGRWWVLGDRTQAPSGAGYAIENRIALSRAAGSELQHIRARRLAPFLESFRETLDTLRGDGAVRAALLTPGPYSETYYEQAFLARYLGLMLLEGDDLVVRDSELFVRTVRGLKKLSVLWRRVDAAYCDPLEFRQDSRLGVPGLAHLVRASAITCVNSLGAGLLEARGIMAFYANLARHFLDEELLLPNIATWWHGDESMLSEAQATQADTFDLSAFDSTLPPDFVPNIAPDNLAPWERVTQESVRLSTMPCLHEEGEALIVRPKPFTLRVFAARTSSGWTVMPGGFCRVSNSGDPRALSMQNGSLSADVWVQTDDDAKTATTSTIIRRQTVQRVPGTLPARAADNLFWLGRYAERAQLTMRLAKAYLTRRYGGAQVNDPLVAQLQTQMRAWGIEDPNSAHLFTTSLLEPLRHAQLAASPIRDRFSPDAWKTLNSFISKADQPQWRWQNQVDQINEALTMLATFAGLVSENMVRLAGWRFLEIGHRLERALGTSQITRAFILSPTTVGEVEGSLAPAAADVVLEIADSLMSFRRRYAVTSDRPPLLDLVVLDTNNPRSIAFQLQRIHMHVDEITDHPAFEKPTDLQRLSFSLWSGLHTSRADDITIKHLEAVERTLTALSDELDEAFIVPVQRTQEDLGSAAANR